MKKFSFLKRLKLSMKIPKGKLFELNQKILVFLFAWIWMILLLELFLFLVEKAWTWTKTEFQANMNEIIKKYMTREIRSVA